MTEGQGFRSRPNPIRGHPRQQTSLPQLFQAHGFFTSTAHNFLLQSDGAEEQWEQKLTLKGNLINDETWDKFFPSSGQVTNGRKSGRKPLQGSIL